MRRLAFLHGRHRLAWTGMTAIVAGGLGMSAGSSGISVAHAAGQTGQLQFLGEAIPTGGTGSTTGGVSDARQPQVPDHPSSGKGSPLSAPSTEATSVSSNAGGAAGFNGISHFDQRTAGTGTFANTQFSLEPPDQGLCVGGGYVLESVNTVWAVYNTAGKSLTGPIIFNQFFKLQPEVNRKTGVTGEFLSDPKCYFDTATGRWFQTILEVNQPPPFSTKNTSAVLIAVSKTSNPTGAWRLFKLDTTDDGNNGTPSHSTCPCLPDQPIIGANADGFYINTNEFGLAVAGFPYNGAQLYAFGKNTLESSSGTPTFVHINTGTIPTGDAALPFWGSLQPATSPTAGSQSQNTGQWRNQGQSQHVEFLLSSGPQDNLNNEAPFDNRIVVWALTGTDSLNGGSPDVELVHQVIRSEVYGYGDINTFGATQKSGPTPLRDLLGDTDPLANLAANDTRMNQVVYADGRLFSGVNTLVHDKGEKSTRVGIAYFVVQPELTGGGVTGSIDRQGYVAAEGNNNVLFPSIGVTSDGVGAMAFTVTGPDFFPSAGYVRFGQGGAQGPINIVGAGVAPEDGFTAYAAFGGTGIARWGDYSAAVATPDGQIWMGTEYIPSGTRTVNANWGTFVSHISADA
jgi:hypothetical protein